MSDVDTGAIRALVDTMRAFVSQWSADEHPPYVHANLDDIAALLAEVKHLRAYRDTHHYADSYVDALHGEHS